MRLRKVIFVAVAVLICSILAFNNYSSKNADPSTTSTSEAAFNSTLE